MGILVKVFKGIIEATFADQWKEIITAGPFDEHTLVTPGALKTKDKGRGVNNPGSEGVISNGSKIFVPNNTVAFIFNQSAIENFILEPGGYEYQDGDKSVFNKDGLFKPFTSQIKKRFGFGGITPDTKRVAYVNLREIRDIKFGTPRPQVFTDPSYGIDLEVHARGNFSIKVVDPEQFITGFVPPHTTQYSVDDPTVMAQIESEFLQSFTVAMNSLSNKIRVSQLPSMANEISAQIAKDKLRQVLLRLQQHGRRPDRQPVSALYRRGKRDCGDQRRLPGPFRTIIHMGK